MFGWLKLTDSLYITACCMRQNLYSSKLHPLVSIEALEESRAYVAYQGRMYTLEQSN